MLKSAKPSWNKLLFYRDQLFAPGEKNEEAENNIPDSPESEKHTGSKCSRKTITPAPLQWAHADIELTANFGGGGDP